MQESKLKLLQQAKEYYSNEGFNILGFFGSYARGKATPQSDIDILYELNEKFIKNYEGVDLGLIDNILRYLIPELKMTIENLNKK